MSTNPFILLREFSEASGLEIALIREFSEFGLFRVQTVQQEEYVVADDWTQATRIVRLYRDLGINKEGIDVILSLRERIAALSRELESLRHKYHHLEQEQHIQLVELPRRNGMVVDADVPT